MPALVHHRLLRWLAMACLVGMCMPASAEDNAESFSAALREGTSLTQFRARYEHVDQDGKADNANAYTLRSLIGWRTKPFHDVSVTAQLINVTQFNHDFYDNSRRVPVSSTYPTVGDPDLTDINQLYLEYLGVPDTSIKAGRQLVQLDNVRFFGNVEFRQASQTFDGFSASNKSIDKLTLYAAHLDSVRQVTTIKRDTDIDILHASYQLDSLNTLTVYGYFLDAQNLGQNRNTGLGLNADHSHKDVGVRADGEMPLMQNISLLYTAEYADQRPYKDGDSRIHAHYARLGAGAKAGGTSLRFDQETLSSNDGLYGFQTPLATLHPFQGWADVFTTTPRQGLIDRYLTFSQKISQWLVNAELHYFESDEHFASLNGSRASYFGREWDLGLTYNQSKQSSIKVEMAKFYEGDVYGVSSADAARKRDIEKLWVTWIYKL